MRHIALAAVISVFPCATFPGEKLNTVSDFAIQCQHPGHKSNAKERIRECSDLISREVQAIGSRKKTPECWASLDNVSPGAISDVIFHLATAPDGMHKSYRFIAREAILTSAQECN